MRYPVVLALALVLVTSVAATSVSLGAGAPNTSLERDLIALTNVDRTSNGLSALVEDPLTLDIARERSGDMLDRNYFSHDIPPTGEKVFAIMQRLQVSYAFAGENLEWNSSAPKDVVQFAEKDFMNSPTHRANILKDAYTMISVGAIPGSGKTMFTVLFRKPPEQAGRPPAAAPSAPSGDQSSTLDLEQGGDFASPVEMVIDSTLGRSLGVPGRE